MIQAIIDPCLQSSLQLIEVGRKRKKLGLKHKGFIIWPKRELFLAGPTWEILAHLACLDTSQNAGFASSCLLTDSVMISPAIIDQKMFKRK